MRLPTRTPGQGLREDARAFHERLWAAYQEAGQVRGASGQIIVLVSPWQAVDRAKRLQWRLHKFWRERGYRLRSRIAADRRSIVFWLQETDRAAVA